MAQSKVGKKVVGIITKANSFILRRFRMPTMILNSIRGEVNM